jgi:hypothetical protein
MLIMAGGCALKETAKGGDPVKTAVPASDRAPAPVPEGIYRARDAVLGYFIPVSVDIISVEDRTVKIRPGDEDHVSKGMRFSVFRERSPFYHPVTNELIGNSEDTVGRIEITGGNAVDAFYQGVIINGEVREGDRARISSSRIKLAFFQDRRADWSVSEAFYGALKDSGRFDFVEAYPPDYSPDTLSKLARGLGAEAALVFSTPEKEGMRFINVKLYWAEDAGLAGEIEEAAQSAAGISSPDDEFISGVFKETKPWRTYSLPGGLLIAMGDVDGNGSDDFAVSDGRNIRIYSVKDDFRELWNIKTEGDGTHLSLDILDVNNNGRAEIFVTSAANPGTITMEEGALSKDDMKLSSFVLEYDPAKGFMRINENIPYFMRVLGKTLLMQRYSSSRIFGGPVYKAKWNENQYEPGVPFVLPEGVNIYGFAFVDWKNEGRPDVMTYDKDGYLCLYDDSRVLKWKSEKSYGPFTFSFESRTRSLVNPVIKWSVRGRLAVVKTDRGQEIVAVNREQVLSLLPSLGTNKAEVYSLWWDGDAMDRKLLIDEIYGSVSDYWIQGRELFLVARAGLGTYLRRLADGEFSGSSILFYYNFGPSETK